MNAFTVATAQTLSIYKNKLCSPSRFEFIIIFVKVIRILMASKENTLRGKVLTIQNYDN